MTLRSFVRGAAAALYVLLSACGGGGGGDGGVAGSGTPSVANMAASSQRYFSQTIVTVQGRNLRSGSGVDIEIIGSCENPTRLTANSSDDTQQFRCDIRGVGELKFAVYDIDSRRYLAELRLRVPAPQVGVTTSMGSFTLELDPVAAPQTVQNFLFYVNSGFYNNVIVNRVAKDRGIETGGFQPGHTRKTLPSGRTPIATETTGLLNLRGTVAMQRSASDATRVDTPWFVNLADNADLDAASPPYPVFGRVMSGLDVVDRIAAVETGIDPRNGFTDVPVTEIVVSQVVHLR